MQCWKSRQEAAWLHWNHLPGDSQGLFINIFYLATGGWKIFESINGISLINKKYIQPLIQVVASNTQKDQYKKLVDEMFIPKKNYSGDKTIIGPISLPLLMFLGYRVSHILSVLQIIFLLSQKSLTHSRSCLSKYNISSIHDERCGP